MLGVCVCVRLYVYVFHVCTSFCVCIVYSE